MANRWRKPESAPIGVDVLVVWTPADGEMEIASRDEDGGWWFCCQEAYTKQQPLKWQPLPSTEGDPE